MAHYRSAGRAESVCRVRLRACGPASVCTILKRLGGAPSEYAAARAAHSCTGGTEAWYLARYVRNQGFVPRFDFRETFSPLVGLPSLVGVRLGGAGHVIIAVLFRERRRGYFCRPVARRGARFPPPPPPLSAFFSTVMNSPASATWLLPRPKVGRHFRFSYRSCTSGTPLAGRSLVSRTSPIRAPDSGLSLMPPNVMVIAIDHALP